MGTGESGSEPMQLHLDLAFEMRGCVYYLRRADFVVLKRPNQTQTRCHAERSEASAVAFPKFRIGGHSLIV
jgi:hypothetical protein